MLKPVSAANSESEWAIMVIARVIPATINPQIAAALMLPFAVSKGFLFLPLAGGGAAGGG